LYEVACYLSTRWTGLDHALPKVIRIKFWSLLMATGSIGVSTRRDQITIMSDLLEITTQPQRLTHILYKSNMSYGQLSKYLDEMINMGFLEIKTKPFRAFVITAKGILFSEMLSTKKQNMGSEHVFSQI